MRTGPAWCWPKRGVSTGASDGERAGELAVAPALLAALPLAGRLVTGDALYCQAALCRQIRQQAGDYLVTVKANQPELLWALHTLFAAPPPGEAFASAVTWDQHGIRVERRQVWASTALNEYLDWPGVRQVLRVERRCLPAGAMASRGALPHHQPGTGGRGHDVAGARARPLAHREPTALGARCEHGRGRLSGPQWIGTAGTGGAAQYGSSPWRGTQDGPMSPRRCVTTRGSPARPSPCSACVHRDNQKTLGGTGC